FSAAPNCSAYTLSRRRSLRFFSSCSSSSVMGIGARIQQQKVIARHAAQNHSLQTVEIVKSILGGFAHRGQERLAWIFPEQSQQLPQGKSHHLASFLRLSAGFRKSGHSTRLS